MSLLRSSKQSQNGSALFYILIACALFASLSYVVAGMMREGDPTMIAGEQSKLLAGEIIDYGRTIKQATQALLINGCDETELNYRNDYTIRQDGSIVGAAQNNTDAPPDGSCDIFSRDGGGVVPQLLPEKAGFTGADSANTNTLHRLSFQPIVIGVEGVGSSELDLVLRMGALKKEVCLAINQRLGIEGPFSNEWQGIPREQSRGQEQVQGSTFRGDFSTPADYDQPLGTLATELQGKMQFCAMDSKNSALPDNIYYWVVLVPR